MTVRTPGGHSRSDFGKPNALNELAEMITKIYAIEVPRKEGSTTTYNVGVVNGGTSVNTIAQKATMLCEYRSNKVQCLEIMKERFMEIFRQGEKENVWVEVKQVGVMITKFYLMLKQGILFMAIAQQFNHLHM